MAHYLLTIFIIFSTIIVLESKKFKITLISADQCDASAEVMDPTSPVTYEIAVIKMNRHTKVIRTNFTVLRPAGPVMMTLKINQLKQGSSKDEIFKLEKVDCHNPVTYQLLRVVNLKLTNDCMAVSGNYLTEKINLQDFAWILTKAMINPGKYEYVLEFHSNKGMVLCNSIICEIQEGK